MYRAFRGNSTAISRCSYNFSRFEQQHETIASTIANNMQLNNKIMKESVEKGEKKQISSWLEENEKATTWSVS